MSCTCRTKTWRRCHDKAGRRPGTSKITMWLTDVHDEKRNDARQIGRRGNNASSAGGQEVNVSICIAGHRSEWTRKLGRMQWIGCVYTFYNSKDCYRHDNQIMLIYGSMERWLTVKWLLMALKWILEAYSTERTGIIKETLTCFTYVSSTTFLWFPIRLLIHPISNYGHRAFYDN